MRGVWHAPSLCGLCGATAATPRRARGRRARQNSNSLQAVGLFPGGAGCGIACSAPLHEGCWSARCAQPAAPPSCSTGQFLVAPPHSFSTSLYACFRVAGAAVRRAAEIICLPFQLVRLPSSDRPVPWVLSPCSVLCRTPFLSCSGSQTALCLTRAPWAGIAPCRCPPGVSHA